MRILIADRNVRLLESISRTFAPDFTITTAMSLQRCTDLLRRGDFDLAIVSEKLSDGPGLRLLGHIARHSPHTLRVLAARRSRLESLGERLGPLGLFRTLAYPLEAQKLSSTLTLARAGVNRKTPPAARLSVERIQFNFTDAMLATNVPMLIPASAVRRSAAVSATRQGSIVQRTQLTPSRVQPAAFQPAPSRAQPAASQVQPFAPPRARPKVAPSRSAAGPRKFSLLLPAALAAGLAALALILHSPHVQLTPDPVSRFAEQRADLATVSHQNPAPASVTLPFSAAPSSAKRANPNPTPAAPNAEEAQPEVAANTATLADPSSFGSEAYESIYSD